MAVDRHPLADTRLAVEKLKYALGIERKVVGVKFLFNEEEYQSIDVRPPKHRFSYCMMVKLASTGHDIKVNATHHKCNGGKRALGFMASDEKVRSGKHYFSFGMYDSVSNAKQIMDDVVFLDHEVYGLAVLPLEHFEESPHTVIIICYPYEAMRIIQGYAYHFGMARGINILGNQAVCSELTARPYVKDEIAVSLLCSNTRFSCRWKDSELGPGMPFHMFEQVVDGVVRTMNAAEPDNKKEKIISRAGTHEIGKMVKRGENYYHSDRGIGKLEI